MRWQLQRPGTSRVAASGAEGVVSHEEPMEITIAVWLGVAVAIMAAMSASHARDLMSLEPGTEIERVASIGNKQLSLPAGKWEVVMSEADRRGAAKAGNVFLVRKAKGRLAAYLFVRTNLEIGSGTGWKRPRWCDRNNVHHNGSDNYYNKDDADCWMLIHRVFTNKMLRVDFYNRMKAYLRPEARGHVDAGRQHVLAGGTIPPTSCWYPISWTPPPSGSRRNGAGGGRRAGGT